MEILKLNTGKGKKRGNPGNPHPIATRLKLLLTQSRGHEARVDEEPMKTDHFRP